MAQFRFFDEGIKFIVENGGLSTHAFKMYLSNAAPDISTMKFKGELAGIAVANGYTEFVLTTSLAFSSQGVWSFKVSAKPQFTASGGNVGPFRRVVLYDDTAANDPLIGLYDYLSEITVLDGDPYILNLNSGLEIFKVRS